MAEEQWPHAKFFDWVQRNVVASAALAADKLPGRGLAPAAGTRIFPGFPAFVVGMTFTLNRNLFPPITPT
jgi:hypothetical protein